MSIERQASTHHLPANLAYSTMVLADFQLPSFIPLVRTTAADENMPARRPSYELDSGHKARCRTILSHGQHIAPAIGTLATLTHTLRSFNPRYTTIYSSYIIVSSFYLIDYQKDYNSFIIILLKLQNVI